MAFPVKKARMSTSEQFRKTITDRFLMETELIEDLKSSFHNLCSSKTGALVSLTINQCNAAYGKFGRNGKTFSQADVDVKTNWKDDDTLFFFGTIFRQGFCMLKSYLDNPMFASPESHMDAVLSKLLWYLLDKDQHEAVNSIKEDNKDKKVHKCDLAVRFAEHLFKRLSLSSSYTIDQYYSNNSNVQECRCGCRTDVRNRYSDTSIDQHEAVNSIKEDNKDKKVHKCDLAVRFAEHLFKRLSLSSSYTIDQYYSNNSNVQECRCGCRTDVRNRYSDTSIGNLRVWHGCPDILLDSNSLPVTIIGEDEPDSSYGKSSIQADISEELTEEELLEEVNTTSQLLAQTITFSFTQKKNHPEYSNFLIPSIGVTRTHIIFYFYDSEHDILLKSPAFPIFLDGKIHTFTILATWFVVNYKYLCSGPTSEILRKAKKANFLDLVDSELPVYQNEMVVGGVPREDPIVIKYEPWFLGDHHFGRHPTEIEETDPVE